VAAIGLPMMASPHLAHVLAGMVLIAVGTFFTTTSPSKIACSTGMSNAPATAEKRFVQSSPLRV
jgi:hypothetical protein